MIDDLIHTPLDTTFSYIAQKVWKW